MVCFVVSIFVCKIKSKLPINQKLLCLKSRMYENHTVLCMIFIHLIMIDVIILKKIYFESTKLLNLMIIDMIFLKFVFENVIYQHMLMILVIFLLYLVLSYEGKNRMYCNRSKWNG